MSLCSFQPLIDAFVSGSKKRLREGKECMVLTGVNYMTAVSRKPDLDVVTDEWYQGTGVSMDACDGQLPPGTIELGMQAVTIRPDSNGRWLVSVPAQTAVYDEEECANRWVQEGETRLPCANFASLDLTISLSDVAKSFQVTNHHDAITMAGHFPLVEQIVPVKPITEPPKPGSNYAKSLWIDHTVLDMVTYCMKKGIEVDFATLTNFNPPNYADSTEKNPDSYPLSASSCGFQCVGASPSFSDSHAHEDLKDDTGHDVKCVGFVRAIKSDYNPHMPLDGNDYRTLLHNDLLKRLLDEGSDVANNTKVLLDICSKRTEHNDFNVVFYSYLVPNEEEEEYQEDEEDDASNTGVGAGPSAGNKRTRESEEDDVAELEAKLAAAKKAAKGSA